MSDSLQLHGLQHVRFPCSSPTPRVCSNSCPWSWWCQLAISSSVIPISSHLQSFPVSGYFQMSQFFISGGRNIGVSVSATVLPMNTQDRFPLWWTGWISLQSKGLSRVFFNTTVQKHQFFIAQLFIVQLSHSYMTTGKTIVFTRWTFFGEVISLLFNMLSRLLIAFFPRSIFFFFNFVTAFTICSDLGAQENKVSHCFHCFPIYLPWSDGTRCHDLSFLNVEL